MSTSIGELEFLILLGVLRLGGDSAYGVSLRDEIRDRTGRDVSLGAVYTALGRLEGKGFVITTMGRPTAMRGGRRKKLCHLTGAGEAALSAAWQEQCRMVAGLEDRLETLHDALSGSGRDHA
ncbi:MAG: helix-turn-helix transcriptional regulator [Acidobacteriota bacterium]